MGIKTLNRFKEGDVVASAQNPTAKLVIRRYLDRIYYCTVQGESGQREQVYFDRELVNPCQSDAPSLIRQTTWKIPVVETCSKVQNSIMKNNYSGNDPGQSRSKQITTPPVAKAIREDDQNHMQMSEGVRRAFGQVSEALPVNLAMLKAGRLGLARTTPENHVIIKRGAQLLFDLTS